MGDLLIDVFEDDWTKPPKEIKGLHNIPKGNISKLPAKAFKKRTLHKPAYRWGRCIGSVVDEQFEDVNRTTNWRKFP